MKSETLLQLPMCNSWNPAEASEDYNVKRSLLNEYAPLIHPHFHIPELLGSERKDGFKML